MRRKPIIILLIILMFVTNISLSYAFWASSISGNNHQANGDILVGSWDFETLVSVFTDFEDVTKSAYASGEIITYGYTWLLDDALIGTIASDLKNDLKSARLRTGVIESRFSIENLRKISFYAGRFGSDSLGTINIQLSQDQTSWTSYQTIQVTSSLTLYTITFSEENVNLLGYSLEDALFIRFRSTDTSRINIDDLNIEYKEIVLQELNFLEDFENATKTAYTSATITINGLNWLLNDALIGTLNQDQKNGLRSIRLRNGHVTTLFKVENIKEISFFVGNYNQTTQSANFTLRVSKDNITWHTLDTITTTSAFVLYSMTLSESMLSPFGLSLTDGLYIRLASNDTRRINIDDFKIIYLGENSFNT
jgi:hypothetical protein